MAEGVENIGKKDVAWSYTATFFTIGTGIFLLPFMLNKLPSETIGIWTVFQTINFLVTLLDMGFKPSFARNISYIFSGVTTLRKEGVENLQSEQIDYSLLKGTISAMVLFYRIVSLVLLVFLATIGTLYFYQLTIKYNGNKTDIIVAWILLIVINCYNLYTLYYESLLTGKGYIKRIQQISIIGQSLYLLLAITLIYSGFGLTAIVTSQLISIITRRYLYKKVFFTPTIKEQLQKADTQPRETILKAIFPNAIKTGLTSLGGFLTNHSALIVSSLFLPLSTTGGFGISQQVVELLGRVGIVYYISKIPKLSQYRAERDVKQLQREYKKSVFALIAVFLIGGSAFVLLGNQILSIIKSGTQFLPAVMLCVMIFFYFLQQNQTIAIGFIVADNKAPFYISTLISGVATILLLIVFVGVFDMGVWGMILAPGLSLLAYQNWKWPYTIIKELYYSKR